jgi:hypothetical protein
LIVVRNDVSYVNSFLATLKLLDSLLKSGTTPAERTAFNQALDVQANRTKGFNDFFYADTIIETKWNQQAGIYREESFKNIISGDGQINLQSNDPLARGYMESVLPRYQAHTNRLANEYFAYLHAISDILSDLEKTDAAKGLNSAESEKIKQQMLLFYTKATVDFWNAMVSLFESFPAKDFGRDLRVQKRLPALMAMLSNPTSNPDWQLFIPLRNKILNQYSTQMPALLPNLPEPVKPFYDPDPRKRPL